MTLRGSSNAQITYTSYEHLDVSTGERVSTDVNEWRDPAHALAYLQRADGIPHRTEGEAVVLELLPPRVERILDLGCGDGRLLALARLARPEAKGVAIDFSPAMLEKARARFADDPVTVVAHDLSEPLPTLGTFDAVISSFAIHHLVDARKRELYRDVFAILEPGGRFCNLEHVSSPTDVLHSEFFHALGQSVEEEDPSNRCIPVDVQLAWLRHIGFTDVDCFWKWRELALLAGTKPA
jgi:tRNA (cmo5U34)-methyltransferase